MTPEQTVLGVGQRYTRVPSFDVTSSGDTQTCDGVIDEVVYEWDPESDSVKEVLHVSDYIAWQARSCCRRRRSRCVVVVVVVVVAAVVIVVVVAVAVAVVVVVVVVVVAQALVRGTHTRSHNSRGSRPRSGSVCLPRGMGRRL